MSSKATEGQAFQPIDHFPSSVQHLVSKVNSGVDEPRSFLDTGSEVNPIPGRAAAQHLRSAAQCGGGEQKLVWPPAKWRGRAMVGCGHVCTWGTHSTQERPGRFASLQQLWKHLPWPSHWETTAGNLCFLKSKGEMAKRGTRECSWWDAATPLTWTSGESITVPSPSPLDPQQGQQSPGQQEALGCNASLGSWLCSTGWGGEVALLVCPDRHENWKRGSKVELRVCLPASQTLSLFTRSPSTPTWSTPGRSSATCFP